MPCPIEFVDEEDMSDEDNRLHNEEMEADTAWDEDNSFYD